MFFFGVFNRFPVMYLSGSSSKSLLCVCLIFILPCSSSGISSQPVISLDKVDGEGLSLVCKSSGWNSEPAVDWFDSAGKTLPAKPTEWNSDGLIVKRRLVVNKVEKFSTYTCKVSQDENTKTTVFRINDAWLDLCYDDELSFYGALVGTVALAVISVCVVRVLYRRMRKP
ncbi:butyrophilin-like protein 9 [Sardina pilchardus]|uniref:butyrophilin-like protein 9 n=1 Tax=Sardina pilchardus TaxID=27697 RepID=UPI002E159B07